MNPEQYQAMITALRDATDLLEAAVLVHKIPESAATAVNGRTLIVSDVIAAARDAIAKAVGRA